VHVRGLTVVALGLSVALGFCAVADTVAVSDYQALHWRLIGPFRGGRVLAVTGIAGDDRHFYFGAVDGGVWATQDAGRTWQPIFDGEPVSSIGAIAVAPSRPRTIYVGTGEADMRSDLAEGDGMYRSTDGGAHWTQVGLKDSRQIARILVDPQNPNIVFVGALGHPYGPNAQRGVFRSLDGGRHWSKVLYVNRNTGTVDLAFKPGDPDTLYAAMWQTRRPPWSVYPPSNGPDSGLYVSHDGGNRWNRITGHGFPAQPGRIGLAVAPSRPDRLYALADGPWDQAGLYRSDDGGRRWQHVSADPRIWQRCWYFCALTVDPLNADRLYVMDTIVLKSEDGGAHFVALQGDATGDDFHELWIDPTNPNRRILGSDQGAQVTLDGGRTWSSWYNQPTAQIYHVSTDNRFPYWVYGAQQDSGAVALPSRTTNINGITMQQFHEIVPGGENGMIVADPDNPDLVYGDGALWTTTVDELDWRTGQSRDVDPTLAYPNAHYRATWTMPLAFSSRGRRTLYFANQRLFSTTDGGEWWTPISPDLTRRNAGILPNLDTSTAIDDHDFGKRRGVIYTIAPSPLSAEVIWVGTDDGLVWRTPDSGRHWINVTPQALTPWSKVAGIELSHLRPSVAYLAIDRHRLDDDTPYIYRTADDGRTWTRADAGIPRRDFVNVVREDPQQPGLLYVGTERGVFVSFDAGAHWQPLQQNLPVTSVRDIDVHGDDLVIATHGRGFWIMDDITALRQTDRVRPDRVTLFTPADAVRFRLPQPPPLGFVATPMPKDEPMAANPPNGAIIDYVLPPGEHGPVTVTILDAHGQVVRRYSSAEDVPPPNPYKLEYAPQWVQEPAIPSATPGMQRFVWDLRYPKPRAPGAKDPQKDGVWAPPGSYTVELGVMGRQYSQPVIVKADPRMHMSAAAFVREFELARKVEISELEASTAIDQAVRLLNSLNIRVTQPSAAHAELAALMAKVALISGTVPHPERVTFPGVPPPRRTDSLQMLSTDLVQLEISVDGADADPSHDALTAYALLSRELSITLQQWRSLERIDVPRLNARLVAAREKPI
jgi:photosystem II stability/assembly factor-like uncharacterized protein